MSELKPQCVLCARHDHAWDEPCPDAEARRVIEELQRRPVKPCRRVDAAAGLLVCRRDYERLETQLSEIPELYALALGELQPGQGSGGRSNETSLGLRVAALDLRAGGDALERLATWERDWREQFDLDPVRAGTGRQQATDRYARGRTDAVGASLTGVCGFLLAHLHHACQAHYAIDEFAHDLAAIHASARAAANIGQRPGWIVDCPADHLDGICTARLRVTGEHYGSTITCPRCRTVWEVSRLLRVVGSTTGAEVWLPAEEVGLLVGLNERTLRKWASKGLVRRQGGRYSVDDVRQVIAEGGRRAEGSA